MHSHSAVLPPYLRSPSSKPRDPLATAYVQGVAYNAGGHIRAPDFDICPWNTDGILRLSLVGWTRR